MIVYTVTMYVDGQHGNSFYVMFNELEHLDEFCEILEGSDQVQYYEIYAHEQLFRDGGGKWKEEYDYV